MQDSIGIGNWMCACRLTRNFFVRSANDHFEYDGDDAAFLQHYADLVASCGRDMPSGNEVLEEVKAQQAERRRQPEEALARALTISRSYERRHDEIYSLDAERFLTEDFRKLVAALRQCSSRPTAVVACVRDLQAQGLLENVRPHLWRFSMFTEEFCDLLEEELRNFADSGLPRTAPNTMNRYGVILRELGFSPLLLDPLVSDYIDPIASKLLPFFADGLDSYRAFTVMYDVTKDGDRDLALHYDNAEITLNANIGGSWTGGQVTFFGIVGTEGYEPISVSMQRGHAILHAGRDMHQAEPVVEGDRHNLILWCRSSEVRNDECPMCFSRPHVIPTNELFHEGFTVPPCQYSGGE